MNPIGSIYRLYSLYFLFDRTASSSAIRISDVPFLGATRVGRGALWTANGRRARRAGSKQTARRWGQSLGLRTAAVSLADEQNQSEMSEYDN